MAKLSEVVGFLEKELNTEGVPDYPGAYNGLQLQNGGEVRRVACAVERRHADGVEKFLGQLELDGFVVSRTVRCQTEEEEQLELFVFSRPIFSH